MEATETTTLPESLKDKKGAFVSSLVRNNKKIREDRAISIAEDTQMLYKREVEDLENEIRKLNRERENALDLSPTTADSLVLASAFNTKEFIANDLRIGVAIRNLEIKLEIARSRYAYLFEGDTKEKKTA